ncbi:hypothetical protein DFH28DRAFT_170133 [Melampsora americana]|nr:hypothetical protein DFH28DRAFT_170133 [Melampsora americana]
MTSLDEMNKQDISSNASPTNQSDPQIPTGSSSIDELFSRLIGQTLSPSPQENLTIKSNRTDLPENNQSDMINVMSLLEGVKSQTNTMEKGELENHQIQENNPSSSLESSLESKSKTR